MKFSVVQLSSKGGRERNEDRMGYSYTRQACLFVVADGMGGHPDGDVAAQLALQSVSEHFQRLARPGLDNVADFLEAALLDAHHHILRHAASRDMAYAPRTTLVAAVVQGGQAWWVHCGDSRLYVIRGGRVLARTRDHSYGELHGRMPPALAGRLGRNVLFTCLGAPTRPLFEVAGPVELQRHDRVVLCSDGLWGSVPDAVLARELGRKPVSRAVPELVDAALRRAGAGSDNVTVVAMEWNMPGADEPSPR